MMIKRIPLILFFLVNTTAIADTSHAYANAVLDALQKKGILNAQEVADIKKQALVAEEKAMQTATKPKQTILTKTTKNITAVKQQVNRASPNIKIWGKLQPRYTFVPSKNGLEGTNSFTLRRARLGFYGFLRITLLIAFNTKRLMKLLGFRMRKEY